MMRATWVLAIFWVATFFYQINLPNLYFVTFRRPGKTIDSLKQLEPTQKIVDRNDLNEELIDPKTG
jgi:hypothetical protein